MSSVLKKFLAKNWAALAALALSTCVAAGAAEPTATVVPAEFDGNVVMLGVPFGAQTMHVLFDTGGYDLVDPQTVQRFSLTTSSVALRGEPRRIARIPATGAQPLPFLVARSSAFRTTFISIPDATLSLSRLTQPVAIDYHAHRLEVNAPLPEHASKVTLHVSRGGSLGTQLSPPLAATLNVTIAGETVAMLLDTGIVASVLVHPLYSEDERRGMRSLPLVSPTLFARWRARHPDW